MTIQVINDHLCVRIFGRTQEDDGLQLVIVVMHESEQCGRSRRWPLARLHACAIDRVPRFTVTRWTSRTMLASFLVSVCCMSQGTVVLRPRHGVLGSRSLNLNRLAAQHTSGGGVRDVCLLGDAPLQNSACAQFHSEQGFRRVDNAGRSFGPGRCRQLGDFAAQARYRFSHLLIVCEVTPGQRPFETHADLTRSSV